MIDVSSLIAFVVSASILTATPGVDTAIVLRAALGAGRQAASWAALGVAIGCLVWGAAVALGLGVLLQTSAQAYRVVTYLGAAYLVMLGAKWLFMPRSAVVAETGPVMSTSARDALLSGLWVNLLNPKVGLFYITFLPQFVPAGSRAAVAIFLLVCIHVGLSLLWFAALIMATVPLTHILRSPTLIRALDRIAGSVLVAFGIKLAVSAS